MDNTFIDDVMSVIEHMLAYYMQTLKSQKLNVYIHAKRYAEFRDVLLDIFSFIRKNRKHDNLRHSMLTRYDIAASSTIAILYSQPIVNKHDDKILSFTHLNSIFAYQTSIAILLLFRAGNHQQKIHLDNIASAVEKSIQSDKDNIMNTILALNRINFDHSGEKDYEQVWIISQLYYYIDTAFSDSFQLLISELFNNTINNNYYGGIS